VHRFRRVRLPLLLRPQAAAEAGAPRLLKPESCISPISPLYIPHISPRSPLDLPGVPRLLRLLKPLLKPESASRHAPAPAPAPAPTLTPTATPNSTPTPYPPTPTPNQVRMPAAEAVPTLLKLAEPDAAPAAHRRAAQGEAAGAPTRGQHLRARAGESDDRRSLTVPVHLCCASLPQCSVCSVQIFKKWMCIPYTVYIRPTFTGACRR